jgi:membrane protease YdiL (CAAX protease family)
MLLIVVKIMSEMAFNRTFVVSNLVAVAGLVLTFVFSTERFMEGTLTTLVFLFLLPLLFIKLILRETASSYFLRWGELGSGVLWLTGTLLVFGGVLAALAHGADVLPQLTLPAKIRASFLLFVVYVGITGFYIFLYEFFFRGFLLATWQRVWGWWAVPAQAMFFSVILTARTWHGGVGKEVVLYFLAGFFAGVVAERTRSTIFSFLFSYLSVILGIVAVMLLE